MRYKDLEGILYNYKIIEQRIKILELELSKMTEEEISIQSDMDGMPRSPQPGNPTERAAIEIGLKKQAKQKRIDRDKGTLYLVHKALSVLTTEEIKVIEARYLEGKCWIDVAKRVGYSQSHAKRIRKSAMEKMIQVLI